MRWRVRSLMVLIGCTALAVVSLVSDVATVINAANQAVTNCVGSAGWTQLGAPTASHPNIRPKDELLAVAVGWQLPGELWGGSWGGLYHSVDCGRTWELVPVPIPGLEHIAGRRSVFGVAADRLKRVFVVRTEETISMSPDNGQTWIFGRGYLSRDQQRPYQPIHGIYIADAAPPIAASPGPDGTVYATVDVQNFRGRRGLWRTTNGRDWEERNPRSFVVLAVDPRNPDVAYNGGAGGIVSRSVDGGGSFERYSDIRCADPFPPDGHAQAMAISPDASRFWLATSTNTLCRSLDEGQTWEHLSDGPPGGTIKSLAIDPFDSRQIFVLTEELDLWVYREPADEPAPSSSSAPRGKGSPSE